MDPFARKMIISSFVFGGVMLVMFAALTVVYLHTRPRCSDRVVAETTDPRRHWTASVMERRCGQEAPFFTHVNIRAAGTDVQTGFFSGLATQGEVFVVEEDAISAAVSLDWSDANTLDVRCDRCTQSFLRKHDDHWGALTIRYSLPTR